MIREFILNILNIFGNAWIALLFWTILVVWGFLMPRKSPRNYLGLLTVGLFWSFWGLSFLIFDRSINWPNDLINWLSRGGPILILGLIFIFFALTNKKKWPLYKKYWVGLSNINRILKVVMILFLSVLPKLGFLFLYLLAGVLFGSVL